MEKDPLHLPPLTTSDIEEVFGDSLLTGLSQGTDFSNYVMEELKQTGVSVEINPFPGVHNFQVDIEDSGSKLYTFSKDLNRLYCNMDRAVPITLKFEGISDQSISHVRAMLVFQDPDHLQSPVFRCRTHTDETYGNNQGCIYYKHVVRCNNEHSLYKEDISSKRHSVITLVGCYPSGQNSLKAIYRFMCSTTCNGPGAIARRRTLLVFTLEDSSNCMVGRAVLEIKICSCPLRDKKRDEDTKDAQKDAQKRKSYSADSETKKIKKEMILSRSPINTSTGGTNPLYPVKTENEVDAVGEFIDLQVTIPQFPTSKLLEFENFLRRAVATFYVPDEYIKNVTSDVQINTL